MNIFKLGLSALGLSFLLFSLVPLAPAAAAPLNSASSAPQSTIQQYKDWIAQARQVYPYRETVDKMYRVMMCESGGNRFAVGGSGRWFGLFQYVPGTWRKAWNPYRSSSIYDARAQIFATAKAWSIGMQNQWSCYYLTR